MKQPKLRFPEFTGDWKQHKFEDVVTIGSGKDYKHLESGNVPVYGTGGYMLSVNQALSESEDAVGIGRKGTIDKPYILRAPFWTVDTLFYCIPNKGFDLTFTNCLFQNVDWKKKDESTGVPSLSKVIINNVKTYVPSLEEQQKIASLFTELDSLIQSAEKELEGYRELKQGMLQKMFPKTGETVPEIRFPEFTGDWEEHELSEMFNYEQPSKYIVKNDDYEGCSKYPVLTANKGFILGYTDETEGIYDKGKVIIFDDFTCDHKFVNFPFKVKSSAIKFLTPKDNYNLSFLSELLSVMNQQPLSHQRHWISVMQPSIALIPSLEEQKKIGEYFSNLDNLITLQQKELDGYKELKKGLLQQMFC